MRRRAHASTRPDGAAALESRRSIGAHGRILTMNTFASRLWLHWDERLKDYVHKPSGATLEALAKAARQQGYRWQLVYPEGRKARWVWFEVHRSTRGKTRRAW